MRREFKVAFGPAGSDKVLAVATALGLQRLQQEEQLRHDFARATLGALGRPLVRVDVEAGAITF